jgi:anaerobic magnesium-protoporphyrin IX monomethyl ester cyclase
MLRILLISPSLPTPKKLFSPENWFPPLGISYLSSILKERNYEVDILDSLIINLKYPENDPIDFEYAVENAMSDKKYDYVGISVLSHTRIVALNISRIIKAVSPNTKVIWGGPHPSVMYEQLACNYSKIIDAIVVGAGEDCIIDVIDYLSGHFVKRPANIIINNCLIFHSNNSPYIKSHIDYLPDYASYLNYSYNIRNISIIGSRGCPFNSCDYCAGKWIPYRERRVDDIVKEIEFLTGSYYIERIHFHDNTFTMDRDRTLRLFNEIKNRYLQINVSMKTRADCIDEKIVASFHKIGGRTISFGLETGNQGLRKKLGKDVSNSRIIELSNIIKDYDLSFGVYILLGHPEETDRDIEETIEFLQIICPDEVVASIVCLYPGTQLYSRAIIEGKMAQNDWLTNRICFAYADEGRKRKLFYYENIINEMFPRFIEWTENSGLYNVRESPQF